MIGKVAFSICIAEPEREMTRFFWTTTALFMAKGKVASNATSGAAADVNRL